jgi:hypothetical protein
MNLIQFAAEIGAAVGNDLKPEFEKLRTEAEVQRKRADFFRDQLASRYECPDFPCKGQACLHKDSDGYPDCAACWDEVERRQR